MTEEYRKKGRIMPASMTEAMFETHTASDRGKILNYFPDREIRSTGTIHWVTVHDVQERNRVSRRLHRHMPTWLLSVLLPPEKEGGFPEVILNEAAMVINEDAWRALKGSSLLNLS